jgi:hypothetical protein
VVRVGFGVVAWESLTVMRRREVSLSVAAGVWVWLPHRPSQREEAELKLKSWRCEGTEARYDHHHTRYECNAEPIQRNSEARTVKAVKACAFTPVADQKIRGAPILFSISGRCRCSCSSDAEINLEISSRRNHNSPYNTIHSSPTILLCI